MDNQEVRDILEVAMAQGGQFAELYLEHKENTGISCENGRIEKVNTGIESGVGIRVINGENTAYMYTNDLTQDNLRRLAQTAAAAAKSDVCQPVAEFMVSPAAIEPDIIFRPDAIDFEQKVKLLKIADQAARAVDGRIEQVALSYSDSCQQVTIANSLGVYVEDERIRTRMACNAIAKEGELVQTGFASAGGTVGFELFREKDPQALGEEAAKRAQRLLAARACPAGKMPVIMASEAGGTMVHEACGHGLEGDLVQKGLSVYAGRLGECVASEKITVVDDATLAGKYGSYAFDDEGHLGRKNVLIRQGVLEQYMYDYHTATKEGTYTTGNGRRQSYKEKPITRMSNTYIAPGEDSVEEIMRSTQYGLLVTKMGGGQVNSINGDYVFDVAEGYMVADGEIQYAVRGATLAGNGPESLQNVEMVADDLGYAIGTCGKNGQSAPVSDAQPTMKIGGLVVGGTAGGEEWVAEDFRIVRR